MRLFEEIAPLRAYLRGFRAEGKTVGLVPTMGALHEGHLSLVRRAAADCDITVLSLFVNPMQFGPAEDYDSYPRNLAHDQQVASREQVDALFVPSPEEMYPEGFQTVVKVPRIASTLEGAHRPDHFAGVATVVAKLLNIVQPDRAFFGQKDFQQLVLIDRLARDMNLPTTIVPVATVREADGLARSSRNAYLSAEERAAAPIIYRALQEAAEAVAAGETDAQRIVTCMNARLAEEPMLQTEYVAVVDPDTFEAIQGPVDRVVLVAVAARCGATRLIDNVLAAQAPLPAVWHRSR